MAGDKLMLEALETMVNEQKYQDRTPSKHDYKTVMTFYKNVEATGCQDAIDFVKLLFPEIDSMAVAE